MTQPHVSTSSSRSLEGVADAEDLRSAIAAALAANPINEDALRRGVWTFVRAERDAGAAPGHVIIALTTLVDDTPLTSEPIHQARLRQVILWCVEAYFSHLGGNAVGGTKAASDPEQPSGR